MSNSIRYKLSHDTQENKESDGRTWKIHTFREREEANYQDNTVSTWKTLEKG